MLVFGGEAIHQREHHAGDHEGHVQTEFPGQLFLTKPFDPIEAMLRVWNLLETRHLYQRLRQLVPEEALVKPKTSWRSSQDTTTRIDRP